MVRQLQSMKVRIEQLRQPIAPRENVDDTTSTCSRAMAKFRKLPWRHSPFMAAPVEQSIGPVLGVAKTPSIVDRDYGPLYPQIGSDSALQLRYSSLRRRRHRINLELHVAQPRGSTGQQTDTYAPTLLTTSQGESRDHSVYRRRHQTLRHQSGVPPAPPPVLFLTTHRALGRWAAHHD